MCQPIPLCINFLRSTVIITILIKACFFYLMPNIRHKSLNVETKLFWVLQGFFCSCPIHVPDSIEWWTIGSATKKYTMIILKANSIAFEYCYSIPNHVYLIHSILNLIKVNNWILNILKITLNYLYLFQSFNYLKANKILSKNNLKPE